MTNLTADQRALLSARDIQAEDSRAAYQLIVLICQRYAGRRCSFSRAVFDGGRASGEAVSVGEKR